MIDAGIVVHWPNSDEYIEIDLDALAQANGITSTLEEHNSKFVRYKTRCEISDLGSDSIKLTLFYDQRENPHIPSDYSWWGSSIIHLVAGTESGDAEWCDDDDKTHNVHAPWERITNGLFKGKKKEVITRIKRNAKFRNALLVYENCCALTGENSPEVLEAAHIIPSKDGGAEVIQNGILLRADVHRLYDAGKFLIDPSGQVVGIKEDVTPAYVELLRNAHISGETVERTKSTLNIQWQRRASRQLLNSAVVVKSVCL